MITPSFSCRQDDSFVYVDISVSYIRTAEIETSILGPEFKLYARPYFLRLTFPHDLVEDGRERIQYDVNMGKLIVQLPKLVQGQFFVGLDMLSDLLRKRYGPRNLIEVVHSQDNIGDDLESGAPDTVFSIRGGDDADGTEFEWDQTLPVSLEPSILDAMYGYGFDFSIKDVHASHADELSEIVDIRNPQDLSLEARMTRKEFQENEDFNLEEYLGHFVHGNDIFGCVRVSQFPGRPRVEYAAVLKESLDLASPTSEVYSRLFPFSPEEVDRLVHLPLSIVNHPRLMLLSVVDILYAYCYNHRICEGENTVESAWTITKGSSTLSWFVGFESLFDVLRSCYRRSLCYLLYRNWSLCREVHGDLIALLRTGRSAVVRALLEIHFLFERSDFRYLLNQIFVDYFAIWVQSLSDAVFTELGSAVERIRVEKSHMNFMYDLEEFEAIVNEEGVFEDEDPLQHSPIAEC